MAQPTADTKHDRPAAAPAAATNAAQRQQPADDATRRMLSTLESAEAQLADLELHERQLEQEAAHRTKLTVSVVIPVYNEQATIRTIVDRVLATGLEHEVLIVDDCSTDGTRDELLEIEKLPGVRVFMHGYNKGKGAAIRTALDHVQGNTVLIQDADLEYNPADYARLLAPIEAGEADVVYGSRFLENPRQDPSRLHRAGNATLTWLSNRATGLRLTDMETCYKVFRTGAIRDIVLRERRFGFEPELTAKLARRKCRIREVGVRYESRSYAEGKKIHLADGVRALYCILRYAWID